MKKVLRYIIIIVVGTLVIFLITRISKQIQQKDEAAYRIQTLPALTAYSLEGNKTDILDYAKNKPVVIIYFSPDCEHCQYEATAIHNHLQQLRNAGIIMITRADSDETARFIQTYQLANIPFVHFYLDKDNQFSRTFGTREFPSIFIYDKEHHLVKKFIGETKIEAIVQAVDNIQQAVGNGS